MINHTKSAGNKTFFELIGLVLFISRLKHIHQPYYKQIIKASLGSAEGGNLPGGTTGNSGSSGAGYSGYDNSGDQDKETQGNLNNVKPGKESEGKADKKLKKLMPVKAQF